MLSHPVPPSPTLPGAEENPAIASFLRWLQEEVEAPTSAL